jgi:hypothetical protein
MKSISNLFTCPPGLPLVADDIIEFHAARLLLLFNICGVKGCIEGLTKMAKLDFFVRYPHFFERIAEKLNEKVISPLRDVESSMIRYHYGPWDKRYYQVLSYLKSRELIDVYKDGKTYVFCLTELGKKTSKDVSQQECFEDLCQQMKKVKKVLGNKTGSTLKKMVYETFGREVAELSFGEVIENEFKDNHNT